MSQKDTHKQKTFQVETLLPDVSDVVKGWMKTTVDDHSDEQDAKLQKFFDQKDVRNMKRIGLNSHKLNEEAMKRQKRQANSKINTDLKYAIINKHDSKKRKRRKGLLVDYGEKEDNEEDIQPVNAPEPVQNDNDDEEELGKSARFTKHAGKKRDIINRANDLLQHYTSNNVISKKKKKKSKKKQRTS